MDLGRSNKENSGKVPLWASSQYDEDEKTAKCKIPFRHISVRDKKFEGYSQLKKTSHSQKGSKSILTENKAAKALEEEYILNLQKQIVLMEQELKLLKEREVEQKNAASGYETLLKHGIPLNEHFIALKNKFNQEKDEREKVQRNLLEDIKHDEHLNREKKHKIQILKHEFEDISKRYNQYKTDTFDTSSR